MATLRNKPVFSHAMWDRYFVRDGFVRVPDGAKLVNLDFRAEATIRRCYLDFMKLAKLCTFAVLDKRVPRIRTPARVESPAITAPADDADQAAVEFCSKWGALGLHRNDQAESILIGLDIDAAVEDEHNGESVDIVLKVAAWLDRDLRTLAAARRQEIKSQSLPTDLWRRLNWFMNTVTPDATFAALPDPLEGSTPIVRWRARSLLGVLAYAAVRDVTDPGTHLAFCETCGGGFFSSQPQANYCPGEDGDLSRCKKTAQMRRYRLTLKADKKTAGGGRRRVRHDHARR